ncbi:hypothetical protein VTL71DRAFT_4485 [Oculimacula yallundae]|uniref:Tautomerase cis-CaaD-like domain-containing protein n=1 Tax=Oculimacula yallundae TaxID=86028 RepID=A0ABR4C3P6_9HELO
MPLWLIFHPPTTFTSSASKKALSDDITKFYTAIGLPAFYVVVNFIALSNGTSFVGGEVPTTPFIRIVINHVAVHVPNQDEAYRDATTRIDEVLRPHVKDRGYEWEYHVDETERRLWKVNGLVAPPFGSEVEKIWVRENRTVEWEGSGTQK